MSVDADKLAIEDSEAMEEVVVQQVAAARIKSLGQVKEIREKSGPDLRIATNWCVITGAPSSGKTTVIKELGRFGYKVKHDLVRTYIEDRLESGHSLEDVRGNPERFYRDVVRLNVQAEKKLPTNETIIFDNAVPDNIAYKLINGLEPGPELLRVSGLFQYARVFVFDRFPVTQDGVRTESEEMASELDRLLEKSYADLGYEVTRVPIMPVKDRVDFLMYELSQQEALSKLAY